MLGLPANDPKIMVYYAFEMDFQNIGTRTEAVTNILRKAAQIYNLSDNMTTTESTSQQTESTVNEIQTYNMPSVVNHSVEYAKSKLEGLGTNVFVLGNGQNVIDQYPSDSSTVETGQRVFLLTDTQSFTMPDMTGWTRKDVAGLWTTTGFGFELDGQGKVISQSVPAGTVVNKGTKIEVVFGEQTLYNRQQRTGETVYDFKKCNQFYDNFGTGTCMHAEVYQLYEKTEYKTEHI